ncbi:hypothetical protein Q7P36_002910 [Cladosporium allicinum]
MLDNGLQDCYGLQHRRYDYNIDHDCGSGRIRNVNGLYNGGWVRDLPLADEDENDDDGDDGDDDPNDSDYDDGDGNDGFKDDEWVDLA